MISSDRPSQRLILEAGRADRQYWRDLWRYRELFFILAWRDVAVRYKQTVIGLAWAFVRPFVTMVVFTVVFGKLAKLPTEGDAPYAVLVFAGLLPWTLASSILSDASGSVIDQLPTGQQGLLPAHHHSVRHRDGRPDRLRREPHHPCRRHGVVRRDAGLAHPAAAGLRRPGRAGGDRSGAVGAPR